MNNRKNYRGTHILAENHVFSTDTWETGTNNNVLVFGPTGSGKTRHYVRPNIVRSHESMIISDTKGNLCEELGPYLQENGFRVLNVDFTDLKKGCGYNPLDYIRCDDRWNEQDILTLCSCLIEDGQKDDPYWSHAAKQYLACLIGWVLDVLPEERHNLREVMHLLSLMDADVFPALMEELSLIRPDSTAVLRWQAFRVISRAEKMDASIRGIVSTNLDPLCFDDACALYTKPGRIDFASLGRTKTAVFLTISDTDRSLDKLADAFLTQALQILCRTADHDSPGQRLTVPVRFYLDDFATNLYIPDFDRIISVIRSREISVSVILQSLSQLNSLYGKDRAATILNNCDRQLYLGGTDPDTVTYIAQRAGRIPESIFALPVQKAYLLTRGAPPCLTEKYNPSRAEPAFDAPTAQPVPCVPSING